MKHYTSGGASDPGSWNRYAYVGGDPVNFSDSRGLARCQISMDYVLVDPDGNAKYITNVYDYECTGSSVGNPGVPSSGGVTTGGPVMEPELGNPEHNRLQDVTLVPCAGTPLMRDGDSIEANIRRVDQMRQEVNDRAMAAQVQGIATVPELEMIAWFVGMVQTGGEWDYKQHGKDYENRNRSAIPSLAGIWEPG